MTGWVDVAKERSAALAAERRYGQDIASWLNDNFPEFKQTSGNPHPAAIAAVIRLHYVHGKGQLRKSEHGPEIRAAVKAFDKKWGTA